MLLAVGGVAAIAVGLAGQQSPPGLAAAQAAPAVAPLTSPTSLAPVPKSAPATTTTPAAPPAEPALRGLLLEPSRPVSLTIPSIGVDARDIAQLGLTSSGDMEVPQRDEVVGWYRHGPTPGSLGPAVLAGHVDSAESGPAVFFRLPELRPGDEVLVGREDGSTSVFVVDRLEQYAKDAFPTLEVYGDLDHAGLRLITCGGTFDDGTGHYRDNIVVYGHQVAVR